MNSPRELFVWYRSDTDDVARVATAAHGLIARIAARCGVQGRLLQREDAASTWMEHYCTDGTPATIAALRAEMLAGWAGDLPERHVEMFAPLTGRSGPNTVEAG